MKMPIFGVGYSAYKTQTKAELSDILMSNVEALTEVEETMGYKKYTGDCVIQASAGATVDLKIVGITISAAKAGADGRVIFKDIRVEREMNGTFLCKPRDSQFFYRYKRLIIFTISLKLLKPYFRMA